MKLRSFNLHRDAVVVAAFLSICTVTILSLLSGQKMHELMAASERAQFQMMELNALESDLKDVETGARGFVITGDSRYLEPFQHGAKRLQLRVARLQSMSDQNDRGMRPLDQLNALAQARLSAAEVLVNLRHSGKLPSHEHLERGRKLMAAVRDKVAEHVKAEKDIHAASHGAVQRQEWFSTLGLIFGVALSLAILAVAFLRRRREVGRRIEVEAELRTLTADLEGRVNARTNSLRQSRKLLISMVEGMPDAVFLKEGEPGGHLRYILINKAAEELFGRSRDDIVGRTDLDLFPDHSAQFFDEDHKSLGAGAPMHFVERMIHTPTGPRLVEFRRLAIPGEVVGGRYLLGIARDVTKNRETEEQLRHVQRMDAVGQLTGGIAHDFNNLLAIILGNLDLLRERVDDGSDEADMTDEAIKATAHGAELVRRLLAFARKQHLAPVEVKLNERLPTITGMLSRTLGENIQITIKSVPDLWTALVDPTQVDDALVNLAINARDAMKDGGSLTIETKNVVIDEDYASQHLELVPGEYVMLAVSDTGGGMPPEVTARAFEPFFTTKAEGQGTGLGLSQVYGWIKQSGGHIRIYSELGFGTTIKLYLPRAVTNLEELASEEAEVASTPRGRERIFVVEDNAGIRSVVQRQLKELGYSTIEAEDGNVALAMVKAGADFDLLLTDIVMPGGVTGYELADQIGKLRPGRKVLFTSGYTELAASSTREQQSGLLLSKPYRKQDLSIALRSVLDGTN